MIASRIERFWRDILLQGREEKGKYHLVAWNTVCKSKEEGGLGLSPIKQMNEAFLGNGYGRILERSKMGFWENGHGGLERNKMGYGGR